MYPSNMIKDMIDRMDRVMIDQKLLQRLDCTLNLLYYPHDALTSKCIPVTEFDVILHNELDRMKEVMLENNGIGLAANQIGLLKQMLVMKDNKGNVHEFVNPKILDSDGLVQMSEGCLSFKGIFLPIFRPESVVVEYQDRNGETKKIMAEGIESRCLQHEIDHLQGVAFISKVSRQVRKAVLSKMRKQ